jgi:hypothetical protein
VTGDETVSAPATFDRNSGAKNGLWKISIAIALASKINRGCENFAQLKSLRIACQDRQKNFAGTSGLKNGKSCRRGRVQGKKVMPQKQTAWLFLRHQASLGQK